MLKSIVKKRWYWILTVLILLGELAVFLIAGEQHTYIGVHDNLDIHITDYKLLKDSHAFLSQGAQVPLLGGISRDFLLSEFYLYSIIHAILPTFVAYMVGYFVKILMALGGGYLLGRDILKERFNEYEWIVVLSSLTYGLLPLYPAFSFSFASIPLLIYLVRRLERGDGRRYYLYLFLYPMVSYFTFFGPFVIGYIVVYLIYRSVKNKKIAWRLLAGTFLLGLGYILIEYRLFRLIFLSGEPTIRDTMTFANRDALGVIKLAFDGFVNNMFHCEDLHRIVVLPIVIIGLVIINARYIRRKEYGLILKDCINLVFLFILFNSLVYGLQECGIFRDTFYKLVPPLKGWQLDRTIFFNPFLWYLETALIAIRAFGAKNRIRLLAPVIIGLTLLVVMGTQSLYNDFYNTIYVNAFRIIKGKESETLSYGEFFSTNLFDAIKEDIDYNGEYSVAYGYHPAVLTYNGISTLDGCLSHYYQSYKEAFREVIAPALEESDVAREYFDEWGGRAYIFSPTTESVWLPERTKTVADNRLVIDTDAFKALGGKYVFSRIEIDNADIIGLKLINSYTEDSSPYTIWVYKTETP